MTVVDPAPLDEADFAVLGRVGLMSGLGPFPEGIEHALDVLRVGAGADACELFLLDRAGGELLLMGCTGPDVDAFGSQERFKLGRGFPGIVARRRAPITTRQLHQDARFLRSDVVSLGYTASACTPVIRRGCVLGTLHLYWKREGADLDRGFRLLDAAGPTLAAALVASFAELLVPAQVGVYEDHAALSLLAQRFRLGGHADEATVVLFGPDGDSEQAGSSGQVNLTCTRKKETACPNELPLGRCVVLRGRRSAWPAPCRNLPEGFARVIGIPLQRDGSAVGVAYLGYREDRVVPATRELGALRAIADNAVLHIRPALSEPPSLRSGQPSRVRLQCFGPFAVIVDGKQLSRRDFGRAKAIELLKVLIMEHGRPISRDALVERLWPNATLKAGARSLHVAMHALRRAIEPKVEGRQWVHVRSRQDTFYLDLSSPCFVDVEEFRRLLAKSHPAPGRPVDDVMSVLERINGLYRGRLFADDPDADWCRAKRSNLHEEYIDALVRLADLSSRHGGSERAISLLRQVSLMEPLREDVHAQLIRSLWSAGRRNEARERYLHCVALLREELGVTPSIQTQRLEELLFRAS